MSYTPAGPISVAVDAVANLLANVPFFQTWTGTDNPADAAARVFSGEMGFPIESLSITNGVLTVSTREPHNLIEGQVASLRGASIGAQSAVSIDGSVMLTAVTSHTFTAEISAPDAELCYPRGALVIPAATPFACVSHDSSNFNSQVIGSGGASLFSGTVEILFESSIATQYQNDPKNAIVQAESELGQLLQGISQTQGTGDFVVLNRVELVEGPQYIADAEQADNTSRFELWRALVRCTWGLSS